jgi:hypothetical protein
VPVAALFLAVFGLMAAILLLLPEDAERAASKPGTAPPTGEPGLAEKFSRLFDLWDEEPTSPAPLVEGAEVLYATGLTTVTGVVEMLPSPGVTITVRVQTAAGKPVAGATVLAVSEVKALTLVTYAPGYRPDLRTLRDDQPHSLRR